MKNQKPSPEELFIEEFNEYVRINLSNLRKFKKGEESDYMVIPFNSFAHIVLGFLMKSRTVSGLKLPGKEAEKGKPGLIIRTKRLFKKLQK